MSNPAVAGFRRWLLWMDGGDGWYRASAEKEERCFEDSYQALNKQTDFSVDTPDLFH